VVAEALDRFLIGATDQALFLRRLDRLSVGQNRVLWGLEVLSQAFALFVRVWLAHTPRIPRDARRLAQASADARYRKLMDRLAEQLADSRRFADDLPRQPVADDDELGTIGRRASDELTADGASVDARPSEDGDDEPSPEAESDVDPEAP
jgi:hypothetical protein